MDVIARRLAALLTLGILLLFPPVLGAFNRPGNVAGLPLLPAYLLGCWAFLVAAAWSLTRGGGR